MGPFILDSCNFRHAHHPFWLPLRFLGKPVFILARDSHAFAHQRRAGSRRLWSSDSNGRKASPSPNDTDQHPAGILLPKTTQTRKRRRVELISGRAGGRGGFGALTRYVSNGSVSVRSRIRELGTAALHMSSVDRAVTPVSGRVRLWSSAIVDVSDGTHQSVTASPHTYSFDMNCGLFVQAQDSPGRLQTPGPVSQAPP